MNQSKQIKNCIAIWDNRLRRSESSLRKIQALVAAQEKKYKLSIMDADEEERDAQKKILQLNYNFKKNNFSAKSLADSLLKEKNILKNIENKKNKVSLYKDILEKGLEELEEIRLDVSIALKKKKSIYWFCHI